MFVTSILLMPPALYAKYEYAQQTGKPCSFCHYDNNGGPLKDMGYAYIRNAYKYPVPESIIEEAAGQGVFSKILTLITGYLHIVAAFILIGAIFYVHIMIKPANLTTGIPEKERRLGLTCLAVITITGIYLTLIRIDGFADFFRSTFGIFLFIKIIFFIVMLSFAVTAVTVVHKKMKEEFEISAGEDGGALLDIDKISKYNGAAGRPAYIIYRGEVYDVTGSNKWEKGRHYGNHRAGTDLSIEMEWAPHGDQVLDRVKHVGKAVESDEPAEEESSAKKLFIAMAFSNLVLIFLILLCVALWKWGFPVVTGAALQDEVTGETCAECHSALNPGIYSDWEKSIHSKAGVDCLKCHRTQESGSDFASREHLKNIDTPVSAVVSPKTCAGCHPDQYNEYSASKHANTLEIIWKIDKWLQHGMNNKIERDTGCFVCHGSVVEIKSGRPLSGSWPNVGVGRKNPDGSLGSCTSCHTRHRFSIAEARKPEACGQCHLGPDHPQIEIYNESKHGAIYHAEGDAWNWQTDDNNWKAGRDFRAPTCSACHISAGRDVAKTHDVTERLSWELQAPLTVRPSEFKPFPAKTEWKTEREKMKKICMQCHSLTWSESHFSNLDAVVNNYSEEYYLPVKKEFDRLYKSGLLSSDEYFDDSLEWEFYELWHHEGRRARMGAAMMAPDYAWWHGFYELKHRFSEFFKESGEIKRRGRRDSYRNFPGRQR